MKKLLFLILTLIMTLVSCDGRDRMYKTNAEVLHDSNLLKPFSEQTKFIPNQPVEIYIDTVLSNGFQVKLKYNSLENNYVSKTMKSANDTLINVNYKNFEAKLQVLKNNKVVTEKMINKELFYKLETSAFWKNAIMQFVWVDYDASIENHINLNTSFCLPETNICKDFTINIDEYGNIKIKEINLTPNTI